MTETQIVSILKEADAGIPAKKQMLGYLLKSCVVNTGLLARLSINGVPSMVVWKPLMLSD